MHTFERINAFTGWDRSRHERFCEEILKGFVKYLDPETGAFHMPAHLLESPAWRRVGNDRRPGAVTADYFLGEAWERVLVGWPVILRGPAAIPCRRGRTTWLSSSGSG